MGATPADAPYVMSDEVRRRRAQGLLGGLLAVCAAFEAGGAGAPCVAVSACLLGTPCRYDGRAKPHGPTCRLMRLLEGRGARVSALCPEDAGGLPRPRPPAELQASGRVVDRTGTDVTAAFARGAAAALDQARADGARLAVLKAKSPSCGRYEVYDGAFAGTLVPGLGMCARLFEEAGIPVIDERDVEQALDGRDMASIFQDFTQS